MAMTAALVCGACSGYGQVLTFNPLLRAQFVAEDPYETGWGVEFGVGDSAVTWWASLSYSRMSGQHPYPEDGYDLLDGSRWFCVAGGLVSRLGNSAALEYGTHVGWVQLHRAIVGNPLSWIGTVEGSALALGASARLRFRLGEVVAIYVGVDAGYRKVQEQRMMYSFSVERPLSDAPYLGLLAGLKLQLQ
jgi:hypothetical protein